MKAIKSIGIFIIGALGYGLIEMGFRGYTHWTMVLTGGAVFLSLYYLNLQYPDTSFVTKCVIGGLIITLYEFAVGCIVNLWFDWGVWSYSNYPLNLFGQVCPLFTFLWFVLCAMLLLVLRVSNLLSLTNPTKRKPT